MRGVTMNRELSGADRFVGKLTWGRFLLGYTTIVIATVVSSIWGEQRFHVSGERIAFVEFALLFGITTMGRPRSLYAIVRNVGWFTLIESDRAMRIVLLILATGCACAAIFHR